MIYIVRKSEDARTKQWGEGMEKLEVIVTLEGQLLERYQRERRIWSNVQGKDVSDAEMVENLLREYFYMRDQMTEKTL